MRFFINIKFPHKPFNAAVRDGTVGTKLKRILDAIKPESVYFTNQNGQRSAIMVIDAPDASKIPALAEPWLLTFEADVEFHTALTQEDLIEAGLEDIGKEWS